MFGRKSKDKEASEQAVTRRVARTEAGTRPFSYYTSRISEAPDTPRVPVRRMQNVPTSEAEQKRPAHAWLTGWAFWLLIIVVVACAAKVLLLSNNPKVVMVNNTAVTTSYVHSSSTYAVAAQKVLAGSVTNRSKLTVNPGSVADSLKRQFPELLDVSMSIPLVSNRPVLYIQPAAPALVLQTPHGNYALNKNGVVLSRLRSMPAEIPVVVDQSGLVPQGGKQVLPSGTVAFVSIVVYQFAAKQLTVSAFVLPDHSPYELDARLEGQPYTVRFNLQADALTQSGVAMATLHQIGASTPTQYLDVRVPGRVYYK